MMLQYPLVPIPVTFLALTGIVCVPFIFLLEMYRPIRMILLGWIVKRYIETSLKPLGVPLSLNFVWILQIIREVTAYFTVRHQCTSLVIHSTTLNALSIPGLSVFYHYYHQFLMDLSIEYQDVYLALLLLTIMNMMIGIVVWTLGNVRN